MTNLITQANKDAYEYNKKVSKELNDICTPLFENTPIKSFLGGEFTDHQNWKFISTNQDVSQYVLLELDQHSLGFKEATEKCVRQGYSNFLWPSNIQEDFILQKYLSINVCQGLTIYEKTDYGSIKSWCFASDASFNSLDNFYLNNMDFIKKFRGCPR